MSLDNTALAIAVASARSSVKQDLPLKDRLVDAMRTVRRREADFFWMSPHADEDLKFRTAVGAVMVGATEDEQDVLRRSLQSLRSVNALLSGVPVDVTAIDTNVLPLVGMWHESAHD